MTGLPLPDHALPAVVSPQEWEAAHEAMLLEEKEFTRARDALAARRRRMPMTRVDTSYRFVTSQGEVGLLELFQGRRQLLVYRFFFQPDVDGWPEKGCAGCSYLADHVPHLAHLNAWDTSFVVVSPASPEQITELQTRMGWRHIPWFSLPGDTFSRDFDVNEYFGLNVFLRDDHDQVYRTYYVSARGVEPLLPTLSMLDLTPLGRQEDWEDTPTGRPQLPAYRARRHDEYPTAPH
ncbi:DUF899 family protein [Actinomycetospora sp. NBRC 106378]|uniref:DUF899 family protein n=1 Tax=Actinomycetospora sp. NBRC 106378 TaxID=3032208 RepID=UPI0024A2833D|nr:DUF899 family protein [Actinomycetospora sp. NBRC 106378]GLZ53453.1 hypothetical protein Acsp07_30700 [Actinomycetospora sp. NBRC 106378]